MKFYTLDDLYLSNERTLDYFFTVLDSSDQLLKDIETAGLSEPTDLKNNIVKEYNHIQNNYHIRIELRDIINSIDTINSIYEVAGRDLNKMPDTEYNIYARQIQLLKEYLQIHKNLIPPFARLNGLSLKIN